MKTKNLMTMVAMLLATTAWAGGDDPKDPVSKTSGHDVRNGGDAIAIEFVGVAQDLVVQMMAGDLAKQMPDVDKHRFSEIVNALFVQSTSDAVVDSKGNPKDVVNFWVGETPSILIHQDRWEKLTAVQKSSTVLHEVLCFLKVESSDDYRYSSRVVASLVSTPIELKSEGVTASGDPVDLRPEDAMNEAKIGVSGRFVQIKAGTFDMGSPGDETNRDRDETQHEVTLTKDFEMQATELTQLQYFLIMGRNPSHFRAENQCDAGNYGVVYGLAMCKNHPVENISWNDMQELISKLNKMQNEYTYRLPTEAEWEYAARAGMPSSFPYSFGFNDTNELDNYAWYSKNSNGRTHQVATKKPNQYGLYDMNGNVCEWAQDWYGEYTKNAATDPAGSSSGSYRVLRGGSWYYYAQLLRSANRINDSPDNRNYDVGGRLVRTRR